MDETRVTVREIAREKSHKSTTRNKNAESKRGIQKKKSENEKKKVTTLKQTKTKIRYIYSFKKTKKERTAQRDKQYTLFFFFCGHCRFVHCVNDEESENSTANFVCVCVEGRGFTVNIIA